jgi:hypothetical protein
MRDAHNGQLGKSVKWASVVASCGGSIRVAIMYLVQDKEHVTMVINHIVCLLGIGHAPPVCRAG